MHPSAQRSSATSTNGAGHSIRRAGRAALAEALRASRADTLATFDAYAATLGAPAVAVPYRRELNPPLWELGHIGWFQEFWIARNPQRDHGHRADPDALRLAGVRADGDALYNSSLVPHASRWHLPLPGIQSTRDDLAAQLGRTLALLADAPDERDESLYFHRLALLHEDMHHEAAIYMALGLGIELADARWRPHAMPHADEPARPIAMGAATWSLGHDGNGFAFDNELVGRNQAVGSYAIDTRPVSWREFAAFAANGYRDERLWTPEGWRWCTTVAGQQPAALRRAADGSWQRRCGTRWSAIDGPAGLEAACHLSHYEALAYCRFAGRRLPTEAEWERGAIERPDAFEWGQVWEWTASAFEPFPGFVAHPYRDYSAPWFDGRPVLKGGSWATQPRMKHPRYRNYFTADRRDIVAGLRTCAV